jgi:hypothetical protein
MMNCVGEITLQRLQVSICYKHLHKCKIYSAHDALVFHNTVLLHKNRHNHFKLIVMAGTV